MQILIKLVLAGIWMGLVPAVSGVIWVKRKKDYTFGESFLAGIIFMFALAEILILPRYTGNCLCILSQQCLQ